VTNPEAVEQLAGAAVDRFSRIDVWVNNAAVTVFAPFGDPRSSMAVMVTSSTGG